MHAIFQPRAARRRHERNSPAVAPIRLNPVAVRAEIAQRRELQHEFGPGRLGRHARRTARHRLQVGCQAFRREIGKRL